MYNTAPEQKNESPVVTEYHVNGSTFIVHSYFAGKEKLEDILKRIILREYESKIAQT
ncbi:hypothetical protein AGMMS49992_30370 [Clostridia bacterium]|nr:hypothetical protein AGMMS49992_30370 [Clostridia bacterium]